MNKKLNVLALLLALALVVTAGALAATALAAPATDDGIGSVVQDADACGGLRMDEFYACHYGGWQPAAEDGQTAGAVNCAELRADELYACLTAGWQPAEDAPVNVR